MKKSKKKKHILELKNTMTELNKLIESFKRRLYHALVRISDPENRTFEVTQTEK